jgi:hypothetical protein
MRKRRRACPLACRGEGGREGGLVLSPVEVNEEERKGLSSHLYR